MIWQTFVTIESYNITGAVSLNNINPQPIITVKPHKVNCARNTCRNRVGLLKSNNTQLRILVLSFSLVIFLSCLYTQSSTYGDKPKTEPCLLAPAPEGGTDLQCVSMDKATNDLCVFAPAGAGCRTAGDSLTEFCNDITTSADTEICNNRPNSPIARGGGSGDLPGSNPDKALDRLLKRATSTNNPCAGLSKEECDKLVLGSTEGQPIEVDSRTALCAELPADSYVDCFLSLTEPQPCGGLSGAEYTDCLTKLVPNSDPTKWSMFNENEDIDKLAPTERIINDAIAFMAENHLGEAAKRFSHWLDAEGTDLPLDVNWLRATRAIQDAETVNHLRFWEDLRKIIWQMQDGETRTFQDKWDRVITPYTQLAGTDFDFLVAVGTTQLSSDGTFTISRNGDTYTITGTLTHSLNDKFDFNPGDVFPLPFQPFSVTANDLNLLEENGLAKPFNQNAKWHETLNAKGTRDQLNISQNNFRWKFTP